VKVRETSSGIKIRIKPPPLAKLTSPVKEPEKTPKKKIEVNPNEDVLGSPRTALTLKINRLALKTPSKDGDKSCPSDSPRHSVLSPSKKLNSINSHSSSSPNKNKSLVDHALHSPRKSPRKEAIASNRTQSPVKKVLAANKELFSNENGPLRSSPRKENNPKNQSPVLTSSVKKDLFDNNRSPVKSPRKVCTKAKSEGAATPKRLQLYRESSIPKEWLMAKKALQTGQNDVQYVGREKQRSALSDFLDYNLNMRKKKGKNSVRKRSLYVSGPPGTGKTSLLRQLLTELEEKSGRTFQSAFINCMALKSSGAVFVKIAESLGCDFKSAKDAQKCVEDYVVAAQSPVLLVLDEIDQLDSKSQQVLYSVYELPHLTNSMLTLVGIANALDLTDRILPRLKLREAVAPGELTFPAYSKEEIIKIISTRLEGVPGGSEVIKPGAVRFLAAKISALSGDVRKALDVCRRALELSEVETKKQALLKKTPGAPGGYKPIDIPQILKIVNEVYSSCAGNSLKQNNSDLPLQQKIIVASLLLMTSYGVRPVKEVTLGKLFDTYTRICKKRGMAGVNLSEVSSLCTMLEARGFFSVRKGSTSSTKDAKLSLRIDEDEVEAALKDKNLLSGIIRDVECIAK